MPNVTLYLSDDEGKQSTMMVYVDDTDLRVCSCEGCDCKQSNYNDIIVKRALNRLCSSFDIN